MGNKFGKNSSDHRQIVGGDNQYCADVILDADNKHKLLVKSDISLSTELSIEQQIDVNEELDGTTYYTIFTAAGVKTISGFALEFSDKKVFVKLELDGSTIFDLDVEEIKNILDWNNAPLPQFYVSWNDNLKVFYFTPSFPIKSQTSITISARGKGGGKDYIGGLIQVG